MKQKFYRYELWEDFQNGMFADSKKGREERIKKAVSLFLDLNKLCEEMLFVANNWKISAQVNFTNQSVNYKAWLGQAACCHYAGCSDLETIEAWHIIDDKQKERANATADYVYNRWMYEYEKEQEGYQFTLFEVPYEAYAWC